jgi:PTS system galactitol-specific IIA component
MEIFTAELDTDTQDMLKLVSSKLKELGYVKNGYEEALIEREENQPTGLAVKGLINVAIPHADAEYAVRQAMVIVGHPDACFHFRRMDEPDETISVEVVFLLVIKESEGYLRLLSDLTELLQDREFIQTMKERKLAPVARFLEHRLDRHNVKYKGQWDFPGRSEGASVKFCGQEP